MLGSEGDWSRTSGRGKRAEASGAIRQFANLEMPDNHGDSNPADKAETLFEKQGQLLNQRGVTQRFGFGVETAAGKKALTGQWRCFNRCISQVRRPTIRRTRKLPAATGGLPAPVGGEAYRRRHCFWFRRASGRGREQCHPAALCNRRRPGVGRGDHNFRRDFEKGCQRMVLSGWERETPWESPGGWAGTTSWDSESGIESGLDRWSNFSGQQQRGGDPVDAADAKPMGMMGGFGGGDFSGGRYSGIANPGATEGFRGEVGGGAAPGDPVASTSPAPSQPIARWPKSSTPRRMA